jgi:FkbM family methyltransferase
VRIFLDVGANTGQSLKVAMRPEYGFGRIVCFEPAAECWRHLRETAAGDERVQITHFGLSDSSRQATLYEPGRKGASLWKKSYAGTNDWAGVQLYRASEWFRAYGGLVPGDQVWLKLNCEGAEVDILGDLLESGQFAKVTHALVYFHGHKIPQLKHSEAELRGILSIFPHVAYAEDVSLLEWLESTCL